MKKRNVDRISDLSDPVIHHIFSFLDMKVVVHTSILSKRWRYLWKSTPDLNFYLPERTTSDTFTWSRKEGAFENLVNRLLVFNDVDTPTINKFSLNYGDQLSPKLMNTWLKAASRRRVREIHIQSSFRDSGELTHKLFTSELRVLNVSSYCDLQIEICMPYSMCSAAKIKCLELYGVKLPEGNSQGELLFSCPSLETMELTLCDISHLRTLTISAPRLESLKLLNSDRDAICDINVCGPNLRYLKYKGSFNGDYSFENLFSLVSASIDIAFEIDDKLQTQRLIKVLSGIHGVKALRVPMWLVKTIAGSQEILKWLPSKFPDLWYLKFADAFDDKPSIHAIAILLEILPHVETLVWERDQCIPSGRENVEGLGGPALFQCEYHSLKTIEITNSKVSEYELKLIDFLLERAMNVKEINIITNRCMRKRRELIEFREKLLSLPQASSNVLISFRFKSSLVG